MGRSRSAQRRDAWLRRHETRSDKRDAWKDAKNENEREHVHFICTCSNCHQMFEVCGLPCFIFCPTCRILLVMQFA